MVKSNSLFVRINYTVDNELNENYRYKAHIVKNENEKKRMICAGIYTKNGGMLIYKAKDIQEAREMAGNNIISRSESRKYIETKKDIISLPAEVI